MVLERTLQEGIVSPTGYAGSPSLNCGHGAKFMLRCDSALWNYQSGLILIDSTLGENSTVLGARRYSFQSSAALTKMLTRAANAAWTTKANR